MNDTLYTAHSDKDTEYAWVDREASKERDLKFDTMMLLTVATAAVIPAAFQLVENPWTGVAVAAVILTGMFATLGFLFSQRRPVYQHLTIGLRDAKLHTSARRASRNRLEDAPLLLPSTTPEVRLDYGDILELRPQKEGILLILENQERVPVQVPPNHIHTVDEALRASWSRGSSALGDRAQDAAARRKLEKLSH